ncbi:MAG: hypothetical protein GC178_12685 [Flavobacteriales bacterium]|nr:hypothetical protein [Flavobacteriales bacterium]
MPKFLVDVNLPRKFSVWHSDDHVHQSDIDPTAADEAIWEYARTHGLTIITKDSDFSSRILLHGSPPKVIHLKVGNMPMKAFYSFISERWSEVIRLSNEHSLVAVYQDHLECIK